ncbi:SH3 domain-containing protein [Alkalibacterium sp. f15]|uniref:SH3 domain-containing protein n=1 Tax=Alkalibacterium sp. f15 TaxID=3414029 RepID=UPI003BF7C614
MIKKTHLNALALFLIATVGLAGCNEQGTAPELMQNEEQKENNEEESKSTIFGNQEGFVYVSADRLSVREESSVQSEILGSLDRGSEVEVLEENESEETTWYKINYQNSENNEGWISSEFTVADNNELHSSPDIFEDEEMNEYFTSPTLFEDNTVVAYYGHPNSEVMGIVGRHPIPELISLLNETTDSYDAVDESKGAIPALFLVYGTVQPGGEIHKMNYDLVMSYIEAAYQSGVLVYLDNQIGKHLPVDAMNELAPFLRYPNVHLALDPEWRTDRPMQEVGHLTGTEINEVQETMRDYIVSNEIQGTKQFVFHQFTEEMIRESGDITSDYDPVLLVQNTSGWGSPEGKRIIHDRHAETTNIPYKGFKLWYHYSDEPGVHYDDPLMTPEQVLDLDPQPGLVTYQ